MESKAIITNTLDAGEMFLKAYLGDLTDADLLVIPVEGMNPIALQLGHLIAVEQSLLDKIKPGSSPALPEGFEVKHNVKEGDRADVSRYLRKDEYVRLRETQRAATKAVLASMTEEELAQTGPIPDFVPTVGATFNLFGVHELVHLGQFVAVRRKLDKAVAF